MDGMPSVLPDGEPVPDDGALPRHALEGAASRPLGFYLHVPYCATRCGYCDFNTYTAEELGPVGGPPGSSRSTYAAAAEVCSPSSRWPVWVVSPWAPWTVVA